MGDEPVHPIAATETPPDGWDIREVWSEYEGIAMHFNDLLLRLRIQALGGIAALSTLVGIFTKSETKTTQGSWEIAAAVFAALGIFWIAIWILDIKYYNRLLIGAVRAILALEEKSKTHVRVREINMSTLIAAMFDAKKRPSFTDAPPDPNTVALAAPKPGGLEGVCLFYSLVLFALFCGFLFSIFKHYDFSFFQWVTGLFRTIPTSAS